MSAAPVLLVDWLGQGGMAHCSEAWIATLRADGREVIVATRGGRELAIRSSAQVTTSTTRGGALAQHVALIRRAITAVRRYRPSVVILQNFVLPQLDVRLVLAAQRSGSRVVLVAHEAGLPRSYPFAAAGLDSLLRAVDEIVVHSSVIGNLVTSRVPSASVSLLPLPLPVAALASRHGACIVPPFGDRLLALHFGNLHRDYKGAEAVAAITRDPLPGWAFAVVGKGAPKMLPGAATISRFLSLGELAPTVRAADVTFLPYRRASQSGAVVLAQALGSVVLASSVGALAEQITDGRTGVLFAPDSPPSAWRERLLELTDPQLRHNLTMDARRAVFDGHRQFATAVRAIVIRSA